MITEGIFRAGAVTAFAIDIDSRKGAIDKKRILNRRPGRYIGNSCRNVLIKSRRLNWTKRSRLSSGDKIRAWWRRGEGMMNVITCAGAFGIQDMFVTQQINIFASGITSFLYDATQRS